MTRSQRRDAEARADARAARARASDRGAIVRRAVIAALARGSVNLIALCCAGVKIDGKHPAAGGRSSSSRR